MTLNDTLRTTVTTSLITALLTGGILTATAHAATTIRIGHPNVPEHPMGKAFEYFKEMVEKRSEGDFQVQIMHSSQFGDFDSVVQGLQAGMLQMGSASTPNLSSFSDAFLIFDMPFLIPNYEAADAITDGPVGQRAANALEGSGILGLGYIEIGFRHIFNNQHPIETLDDTDGMQIRSTPSDGHVGTLESLGFNPTPIAWTEVYTALQQETVDGVDIDLNLAWFNNFHEVTDHLTLVGSLYSPHLVMINESFYQGLDPRDQIMLTEAFTEMKLYQRELIRENEEMILEKMEASGLNIVELTPEERERWADATQEVYEEYGDEVGRELIEEVRETVSEYEE